MQITDQFKESNPWTHHTVPKPYPCPSLNGSPRSRGNSRRSFLYRFGRRYVANN